MDITVKIEKPACGHIHVTYISGKESIRRTYLYEDLKTLDNPETLTGAIKLIEPQVKKDMVENTDTINTLKTNLEKKVYKI
ncbi:MAG: hypothetical protein GY841_12500 [FCB group bacterium]|nr:hypothetical protein [FCB group bacterium]